MRTPFSAVAAATLILAASASAQLRVPGTPAARTSVLSNDVPTISVPVPDIEAYILEDRWRLENGVPAPLRFGAPVPVSVDMNESGRWDVSRDGELVWRIRFESPGAHSLGLEFANYRLPEGAQLFVYDDELTEIYGAFDHTQNNPDGQMAVSPFPGDSLVVEYKQAPHVEATGEIVINSVIYDYADFFEMERVLEERELHVHSGEGGVTGGCNVGANCPQFDAYALQKRATVRTISGGGFCSASLINNTANNETPYVYTANHCGQTGSTVFRFRYIQSGCEVGSAPSNFQISGCTVLATDQDTDGRLLRINTSIPDSYQPYYNGWSRSSANPSYAFGLHFPGGAPMCGIIDSNGGGKITASFSGIGLVLCWNINSQVGGTVGGSSGSPLFNQNRRTIGTLTGGPASCFTSNYARFYEFWNDVNIAQYLDPLGTGAVNIDGLDPFVPPPPTGINITAVSPQFLGSVEVDGVEVVLTGTGFSSATDLTVDGIALSSGFPPEFVINSDTQITIQSWPQISHLGSVPIEVSSASSNDTANVTVQFPISPTLDVNPSEPDFVFTAVPIEVLVGARPGAIVFNCVSPDNLPTIVPGVASLGIGNNLTTLFVVNAPVVGAGGYTESSFSAAGVPPGKSFYWQAGVYDPTSVLGGFPLLVTNIQKTTILF